MKRITVIALLFALLVSICACGSEEKTALRLYVPNADPEEDMLTDAIEERDFYGESTVDGYLGELLPMVGIPGVHPYRYTHEGNTLWLNLDPWRNELSDIDRMLIQNCIVLTLLQVEGVERVGVTEGGRPLVGRKAVFLSKDDMLFAGAEEQPREMTVELYFPRLGGRGLGVEMRQLTLAEDADLYATVMQALLIGPESGELVILFPERLELLDARVEDGICYVNFSAELLDGSIENPAEQDLLLYSIVDTLGNLDAVNAVQVLVEGEVLKSYGTTDTSLPLEPDFALLT